MYTRKRSTRVLRQTFELRWSSKKLTLARMHGLASRIPDNVSPYCGYGRLRLSVASRSLPALPTETVFKILVHDLGDIGKL